MVARARPTNRSRGPARRAVAPVEELVRTRAAAVEAFRQLRVAVDGVVESFTHQQLVADRLVGVLEGSDAVVEIVQSFGVPRERMGMVSALDRYETARRESRLAMWRLLMAEGCSIGEIARMFGLSRQLVSRQLKEDDEARASG